MREHPILFFSAETRWIRSAAGRLRVSPEDYAGALNRGEKICGICRRSVPRNPQHFGASKRNRVDGMKSVCRECDSKQKKAHYHRTRPQQRARQLVYQQKNRAKCYALNAAWQRKRHRQLRAEMLAAYGAACGCCGESQPIFLDLDHINNDGNKHRREVGNTDQVMIQLKSLGWPKDGYQILCCNCNQGKARNGGVCPHKQR